MKAMLRGLSIGVVLGLVSTASAEPPWCSGFAKGGDHPHPSLKDLQERDDARWVVPAIAAATCAPDGELRGKQGDVTAARERWAKKLDMSDADWADAVAYAQMDRYAGDVQLKNNKRAWSGLDAIDQYLALTTNYGASGDITHDKNYIADAFGGKITALARAGYVRHCIGRSDEAPVQWAMCAADIAALDWSKVAADLRASKAYDGAERMKIRLQLLELKAKLVEHAAAVKKLMAKDPGYGKVFDIVDKTRKEWEAGGVADPALVELATAMDDARITNSRSGFAGCADKTWSAWRRAMATIPAKKYEGVRDDRENGKSFLDGAMAPIVNNPNTYLASVAYTICMGIGGDRDKADLLVRELGSAMERWPGFRGPRTAAQTAVMAAGIELDDRGAKLEYPDVSRSFGASGGSHGGGGIGVVASVKSSGKTATVTFKKQTVKEQRCTQSKMTNRISHILSDGTFVYYHNCLKYGVVTVDKTDGEQTVSSKYVEGVKPGVQFTNIEDVVLATWAKAGATVPTTVFGVALK